MMWTGAWRRPHSYGPDAGAEAQHVHEALGLIDAAADLYSPFRRAFMKVILPLSLPGVFAGTLLTFIPATGDFINAELLGSTESRRVIGNAVRTEFLNRNDYPTAAAISFVLMAIITVLVMIYAKFLGTEDLA